MTTTGSTRQRSEPQSPLCSQWRGRRKQWHGQSAAAPVPSLARPLRGRIGKARRSVHWSALRRRRGQERGLAAQPCAGAVQPWRRISGCTDRSAGGCADRRTFCDHSCASHCCPLHTPRQGQAAAAGRERGVSHKGTARRGPRQRWGMWAGRPLPGMEGRPCPVLCLCRDTAVRGTTGPRAGCASADGT